MNPYIGLDKAVSVKLTDNLPSAQVNVDEQLKREAKEDYVLRKRQWSEESETISFLKTLELRAQELNDEVSLTVMKTGKFNEILTAKLIASQTLRGIIDYVRTGKYNPN